MTKKIKSIRAILMLSILLFSTMIAVAPTPSAAGPLGFVNLNSYVRVDWSANRTEEPIIPRGEMRQVGIDVTYGVTYGSIIPFITKTLMNIYQGRQANIKMEILETPEWCTATLKSGTLTTQVSMEENTIQTVLTIQVDEDAPAYGAGYIRLKVSIGQISMIDGYSKEFDLTFTPEYLPLVDANVDGQTSLNIGPLDSAVFPINIKNLGNARTTVFLDVDPPNNWIAVVTNQVTIPYGSNATAYLTVKPPKEFGWHYDREQIKISVTPARAENIQQQGETTFITVMVESRGFSTPGFESIAFIGALMIALLFVRRRKRKEQ